MELDFAHAQRPDAEQAANALLAREIVEREQRRGRRISLAGGVFANRELARYPASVRREIIAAARPALLRDWHLWFWVAMLITVAGFCFGASESGLIRPPFPIALFYLVLLLAAHGIRLVWRRHVLTHLKAHPR